jgi:hypothetical protein
LVALAHVDLTLSDLRDPHGSGLPAGFIGPLDLWSHPVSVASEPCVLIDAAGVVIAASPGCGDLLGIDAQSAVGRRLVDGVLHLLDFGAIPNDLPSWEAEKIPPCQAASTGGLSRGLLRVRGRGGLPCTVDAISVPLRDAGPLEAGRVVGSLTFFARVAH